MKQYSIIFLAFFSVQAAISHSEFNSVMELLNSNNPNKYDSAYSTIQKFNKIDPNDPEIYVLIINYYFAKSRNSYLEIQKGKPTKDTALILKDQKTGKDVGYIQSTTEYNNDTLIKGINLFKKGLQTNPNRLDMHFGLVTVTAITGLYRQMTDALLTILNQSVINHNNWLWSFGEKKNDNPKQFMLENIQGRAEILFNLQNLAADSLIIEISKSLVEKYPECIYGYNDLGVCYLISKEYNNALKYLKQAYNIDPKDELVISNIAEAYMRQNMKSEAKKYYILLEKYGTDQHKIRAKNKLIEIGN